MSTLFGQNSTSSGTAGNLFSQPLSSISNQTSNNNINNNNQPAWFQNPKKRTIPNHLVPKRKPGFQISSTSTSKKDSDDKKDALGSNNSSQFNLLSFGTSQRKALTSSGTIDRTSSVGSLYDTSVGDISKYEKTLNDTLTDDFPLYNNDDDLPPSRSIYDLNDEVLISLNKPANQHADAFINKDPKNFNNVFNRDDALNNNSEQTNEENLKSNPLQNGESAILIFGYPESMANQVISYFQEFGSILEEFEITKQKNTLLKHYQTNNGSNKMHQIVPILSGRSWVKITFDNPASAIDALQENGCVFNGVLLGVIPFSKDAIEKLQKRKLEEGEDIGGGFEYQLSSFDKSKKGDNTVTGESNDIQGSYITRLDIRDGSGLFLQPNSTDPTKSEADKKKEENLGFVGKIFRYFFGFNEL